MSKRFVDIPYFHYSKAIKGSHRLGFYRVSSDLTKSGVKKELIYVSDLYVIAHYFNYGECVSKYILPLYKVGLFPKDFDWEGGYTKSKRCMDAYEKAKEELRLELRKRDTKLGSLM